MRRVKGSILFNPVRGCWIVYYSYLSKPFDTDETDGEPEEDEFSFFTLAIASYRERDRAISERMLRIRQKIEFARAAVSY